MGGMIKTNPARYVLFPLSGLALVLSLILIQFSGKSSISHPFGFFTISGAAPSAPGSDGVSDFNLSGAGLQFVFRGNRPLILRTADNADRSLRAKSYSLVGNTLLVEFQYNLRLRFQIVRQTSLDLEVLLPAELEGSRLVRIPIEAPNLVVDSSGLGLPVAETRSGNQRYFVLLPYGSDQIKGDRGYLEVHSLGNRFPTIKIVPAPAQSLHAADLWLGQIPATLDSVLDQALEVAYQGWRFGRRRGVDGWTSDTEAPRVSDAVVYALLSEAERRNQFLQVWSELGANPAPFKSSNLDTAAYVGDIVQAWRNRKATLERVLSQILQGNWNEWAEDALLLRDYSFLGDRDTFQLIWERFSNRQPQSAEEAIVRLEALSLVRDLVGSDAVDRLLVASARAALGWLTLGPNDLILVRNQRGFLDYTLAMRLGAQYYRIAPDPNASGRSFRDLGKVMLSRILALGQGGLFPRVAIPTDTDYRSEGRFGLEEVYRYLYDAPNRPRFLPLPSLPGGLAFVRTSASVTVAPSAIRVQSAQPPGLPQFLVLQGVPSFDSVVLHGIRWRSDPSFQNYSDGWLYDAPSRTFWAKITNRQSLSELIIQITPTN